MTAYIPHTGPWPDTPTQPISVVDLHRQLGEVVKRMPIDALPRDRPNFGCSFSDIPQCPYVDMSAIQRLEDNAATVREEIGEARWSALQAEWEGK